MEIKIDSGTSFTLYFADDQKIIQEDEYLLENYRNSSEKRF